MGEALHTNLGERQVLPFSPHEGRLLDPNSENLQLTHEGYSANLPWLKTKKSIPDPNYQLLTGNSHHYCLYDTFHEKNTKDPKDSLRKI